VRRPRAIWRSGRQRRSEAAPTSLVNNAGIFPGDKTPATEEETFDRVFAVKVKAPFFLTAAIAPAMAERGEGANLGSWVARLAVPVGALYASSRGALETLARA
jgi:NAD(P)-dependent dehydrogenase (short-subunit alcohol dehydrogenase family)